MAVVVRVAWEKEPERFDNAALAESDTEGRLRVWSDDGRLIQIIQPGDWIDAQVDDGPVIRPPQAF